MLNLGLDRCQRILCLGAHADDIEIGCGATLLELIRVHPHLHIDWVVLSGNAQRQAEARRSATQWLSECGSSQMTFKPFRDSYFPAQWTELKDYFHQLADETSPDIVFTHRGADKHQDHRVVAELTACAFRNQLLLEYEIPKFDGDLTPPNCYFPVTQSQVERKIELLQSSFPSQSDKPWYDAETFRGLMRLRGVECNSDSRYAEAFHVRKLSLCAQTSPVSSSDNAV